MNMFKKALKRNIIIAAAILLLIIGLVAAFNIYLEILQLEEIGGLSGIYTKNLVFKIIFAAAVFVLVFAVTSITNVFIKRNALNFCRERVLPQKKLPNFLISIPLAFLAAVFTTNVFYDKALSFFNAEKFGTYDPLFGVDIGYYVFQRPFLMSVYDFVSAFWVFIILYTAAYYFFVISSSLTSVSFNDLKDKKILRHNLANIAIFFVIKAFSYKFLKEGVLYSSVVNSRGAGNIDVNLWIKYYTVAPYLLIAIVAVALVFILKGRLKLSAIVIAIFPAVWILVSIAAQLVHYFVIVPNEYNMEKQYLEYHIEKTREAYNFGKIIEYDFDDMESLTPEIINRNLVTKNNIRVVDYGSTLVTNIQTQSIKNFYTFHEGDIVNYKINGKDTPVFITAREIDSSRLPDRTYLNTRYKYTHGYGIVINPINKLTPSGQVPVILGGLEMVSDDPNLKVTRPQIYFGELTDGYVIVDAANNLNEVDYDGNRETRYQGKAGIRLNLLNRLLFAIKYRDMKLITSGYAKNALLLTNRQIIERAQKAMPFLTVDSDPYILLTEDGKLKWVLDAYTTTDAYPYAQNYGNINYIRNSVKIIMDAYDGKAEYYIIDHEDPIIKTYDRIYPGIFKKEPLPPDIAEHMRYPELLFKIQTEMLKKYHLKPENVLEFYTKQDLWDIAKYPSDNDQAGVREIDPYYNMIKLPEGIGEKEELILMRPFTPSGEQKHNMVSWLAVRNSSENYGEMILFNFPENTNIIGPYQVEVKINQDEQISKDMTLWGQRGTDVYKGSLLVIPIENSILYVEPIYIRAAGTSSIPEVRELVVGYQKGDEFIYGIGKNLDEALNDLFKDSTPVKQAPETADEEPAPGVPEGAGVHGETEEIINDIIKKYEEMQKNLKELGELIEQLR